MRRRLDALGAALVCVVLAIYLGLAAADADHVRHANEAGARGDLGTALREAAQVTRAPATASALVVRARALTDGRRLAAADRAWTAAATRSPNDWQLQYEWARALGSLGGDIAKARRIYARARELNPRLPRLR
jgi:tetratricopeptide (TPR) repeat protein